MKGLILVLGIVVVFTVSASNVLAQPCEGNFDCDQDVDGTDAAVFKSDFGRSPFFEPCPPCQGPAPVPKTGQTTSWATGDDGDLEKGVPWPNPRFTDNGDGTVTDNLTGLIWLKNANCFNYRTWNNAMSDPNGLSSGQCGLTDGSVAGDWRLPNYKELFSLVDAENHYDALPNGHPFTNVQFTYWSSTTYGYDSINAWYVSMAIGSVEYASKGNGFNLWPVRGGQ